MPEFVDRLTTALRDRYRVERELGAGGMALVYLAEDLKHRRKVAVKVLKPEVAAAVGKDRFLREITTTANLHHPHILPLYDSGERDGFLFYVMPFVEGESLRDRVAREKQLPVPEALRLALEVADALSYAHSRGVIHRDIKPANILLESGHAVVADFGIARALDAAGGDRLTETGLAVGTPAYMSPEQAAGADVDARSDLYSLGCVLYEMLAGQPPFIGPTAESVVRQHLVAYAPPITQLRPAVPPEITALLARALAKTPADRFNPAAQFVEALSRSAASLSERPAAPRAPAKSVGVLPFASLSSDPEDEFLADGITEEIINALAQIKDLQVAARTSSFAFKGKQTSIAEVGGQLGVSAVLEGSLRKAGKRLRVTAQLINVADGYHLWSERYDRQLDDIFAIQDEIAGSIAERLKVTMTGRQETGAKPSVRRDVEAYQLFLKGRHFWNQRTKAGLERAIEYFQRAVEQDDSFAPPHAGLANAYLLLGSYNLMPLEEAHAKAKASANDALARDERLAEAHAARAQILRRERNRTGEEAEYRRAIELNPNYATAHQWYATLLAALGRFDEAIREARRAEELDPLSHAVSVTVGIVLYISRQYEAALAQLGRALELDPGFASTHVWLANVRAELGRYEDAIQSAQHARELSPDNPNVCAPLAVLYARLGERDKALALVQEVEARGVRGWPGIVHAALGDHDRAFQSMEQAFRLGESWESLFYLKVFPQWDPLRSDPRFADLLKRMNLPS
jgi:serine/threonine protein kinase/tetratricopeptide (TPR) repeat protein